MAGPVTFSYADWVAIYPQFAAVSEPQANGYFGLAQLYFENTTCNPAFGSGNMAALFYLLVSHIAQLNAPRDANGNPGATGQSPSPLVGRINSASEGSVSVGAEWKGSGSPSEDWYVQTSYGAQFWAATAQYRLAIYMANPTFVPSAIFPGIYPPFRRW